MVFSSTVFLFLFLPLVLLIYYNPIFRSRTFRNVFLLLASLFFYAWGEPVFVFLMLLSILVTWGLGTRVGVGGGGKTALVVGILYHLAILFVFKYLAFFVNQFGLLIFGDGDLLSISLPIGISFFTFQMMSYLFDIYYGKATAQKNPLWVGLYVALFPQLIAGPIVRYGQVAEELTGRTETFDDFTVGMRRFVYGLGKKLLIANYVAQIADNIFDYVDERSVAIAWIGAIAYTLQIYFDFSGYSDMAIGLGRMFGFHFPENFNFPYISRSVTEFWRRWHISLSGWFRDYVYIPLGGNRVKKSRWIWNLFVVWALTGLWHGANWTFLAWGLFYFVMLLMEKLTGLSEKKNVLTWAYTMLVVLVAWVIFRSESITSGLSYIGNLFGVGATGIFDAMAGEYLRGTWVVLAAALFGATPLLSKLFEKLRNRGFVWVENLWLLAVLVLSILQAVSATYNPFIYFNF